MRCACLPPTAAAAARFLSILTRRRRVRLYVIRNKLNNFLSKNKMRIRTVRNVLQVYEEQVFLRARNYYCT